MERMIMVPVSMFDVEFLVDQELEVPLDEVVCSRITLLCCYDVLDFDPGLENKKELLFA
jgi:hypothetical protein